ncbi:MAG: arylsulfotransferase family protein [Rhodospirillales bacterium]
MKEPIAIIVSYLSALLLAFGVGVIASMNNWSLSKPVKIAYDETLNLVRNWRNDLGFEPERVLVPSDDPKRAKMTIVNSAKMAEGYRFVSGVSSDKDSRFGVFLFNRRGEEIHFWPIRYDELTSGKTGERNVFPHGTLALRDGSIVVNFDHGETIARIGPCGDVRWTNAGKFHHIIHQSYDGTLWSWQSGAKEERVNKRVEKEYLVQLDPDSGRVLRRIDLVDDVITPHKLHGIFAIRSETLPDRVDYQPDPFHPNDIDVLSPEMASAFPMFEAGDLLISLRSLNMIAVFDSKTLAMKWSRIGPWHRQHDPDFQPDGTIALFNNNTGLGASQILAVDPKTGAVTTLFDGARTDNFYTWQRGNHQILPNGNIIAVETERGRVVEVDRTGAVVWRYENVFDATRNGLVNTALVLPPDFFDDGVFQKCRT